MSDRTKGVLVIIIVSILGGAISPVTKIGLVEIPPFTFSFIRFLISSLCILPFFLRSKMQFNKDLIKVILMSILPTLNVALFVIGIKSTTASISQFLYAATPLLAGIISYFVFKEKLSYKKWFFILIGLFGVALVIFLPLFQNNVAFAGSLVGNSFITIGVLLWSIYFVFSKRYQKKYSPTVITSIFIFVATVIFFLFSVWELQLTGLSFNQWGTASIFSVLYVSIFGTVVTYLLLQYAIKFSGPVLASLSFYLLPISTYILSYALLKEEMTVGLIVGTLLVFLSVSLTTYSK